MSRRYEVLQQWECGNGSADRQLLEMYPDGVRIVDEHRASPAGAPWVASAHTGVSLSAEAARRLLTFLQEHLEGEGQG